MASAPGSSAGECCGVAPTRSTPAVQAAILRVLSEEEQAVLHSTAWQSTDGGVCLGDHAELKFEFSPLRDATDELAVRQQLVGVDFPAVRVPPAA